MALSWPFTLVHPFASFPSLPGRQSRAPDGKSQVGHVVGLFVQRVLEDSKKRGLTARLMKGGTSGSGGTGPTAGLFENLKRTQCCVLAMCVVAEREKQWNHSEGRTERQAERERGDR